LANHSPAIATIGNAMPTASSPIRNVRFSTSGNSSITPMPCICVHVLAFARYEVLSVRSRCSYAERNAVTKNSRTNISAHAHAGIMPIAGSANGM
jgi:hypothetical protein